MSILKQGPKEEEEEEEEEVEHATSTRGPPREEEEEIQMVEEDEGDGGSHDLDARGKLRLEFPNIPFAFIKTYPYPLINRKPLVSLALAIFPQRSMLTIYVPNAIIFVCAFQDKNAP